MSAEITLAWLSYACGAFFLFLAVGDRLHGYPITVSLIYLVGAVVMAAIGRSLAKEAKE